MSEIRSGSTQREHPAPPFPPQHQERPGLESKMSPAPRFDAPGYVGTDKLKDRVALVTGGDSGIGRAAAILLAREGADVAIAYLPEEQEDADVTAEHIRREGRRCLELPGDLRDRAFCDLLIADTVRELGGIDILVNNAAYQEHQPEITDIDDEQWDRTFRTNIYACFYLARAAVPHMRPGSAIVNVGSVTGLEGKGQLLDYATTKGALHAFTKSLAQNLVEKGIRVNAVAPGPVWTPLNVADKPAGEAAQHGASTPMGRPAQPDEIAPAIVFFASPIDSSFVTGEVLSLLGGSTTAG